LNLNPGFLIYLRKLSVSVMHSTEMHDGVVGECGSIWKENSLGLIDIRRAAHKSLVFPISCFPVCSTTKIIFLVWFKEVITTKS
jgi:hypothetical protein